MKQTTCDGSRKRLTGKTGPCGGDLFYCGNCRAEGCRKHGCDKRLFVGNAKCRDCSHTHVMFPISQPKNAESIQGKNAPRGRWWEQLNIDKMFAAGLALLVLTIGAFTLLLRNAPAPATSNSTIQIAAAEQDPAISVDANVCGCYKSGFTLADEDGGVLSADYKTGFVFCREVSGARGGEAWTAGWNARMSSRPFETSCRRYLNRSR